MVVLAEECAEVQQAVMKYLRHGGDSWNPRDATRETNREALHRELGDVAAATAMLARQGIIDPDRVAQYARVKEDAHLEGRTPLHHLNGGEPTRAAVPRGHGPLAWWTGAPSSDLTVGRLVNLFLMTLLAGIALGALFL